MGKGHSRGDSDPNDTRPERGEIPPAEATAPAELGAAPAHPGDPAQTPDLSALSVAELTRWVKAQLRPEGAGAQGGEDASAAEETAESIEEAWGSALGVALLELGGGLNLGASVEERLALALNLPEEAGHLFNLEETDAWGTGWALFEEVGTRRLGPDPVDPRRLSLWLRALLRALDVHPTLGATVSVGRGFLARRGPVGPAVDAITGRAAILPGMVLVTARVHALLLSAGAEAGIRLATGPIPLGEGEALARITLPPPEPPPWEDALPGSLAPSERPWSHLGHLLPPGETTAAGPLPAEYRGAATAAALLEARPRPDAHPLTQSDLRARVVRRQAYRNAAVAPLGLDAGPALNRGGALPFAEVPPQSPEVPGPIRLGVGDVLEITLRRSARAFVYLLTQSNFELSLVQTFTPVADSDQESEIEAQIILGDCARYMRPLALTCRQPLPHLRAALELINRGPALDGGRGILQLDRLLHALHPGVAVAFSRGDIFQVLALSEAPPHPALRRAEAAVKEGRLAEALEVIDALPPGEQLRYHLASRWVLRGRILRRLHRHGEARRCLVEGARLASACMAPTIQAEALRDLARSFSDGGEPETALSLLQEAHVLSAAHGDEIGRVHAIFQEAVALFTAGRYEEALQAYRRVAEPTRQLKDPHLLGACHHGQGEVLLLLGRLEEAKAPLELAIELYQKGGDRIDLIRATADLAEVYLCLKDTARAFHQYHSVVFLMEMEDIDLPPAHVAVYRARYARSLAEVGRLKDALDALVKACDALRALKSSRLPDVLVHLAELALRCEDLPLAHAALEELGPLRPPLAVDVQWRGALATGQLRERRGLPGAEDAYLLGLEALEAGRDALSLAYRSAYLDTSQELWNALIELKIKEGHPPMALLETVERVRARWFQDALIQQQPTAALRRQGAFTAQPWASEEISRAQEALPEGVGILEVYSLPAGILYLWLFQGEVRALHTELRWSEVTRLSREAAIALTTPPAGEAAPTDALAALSEALLAPCAPWLSELPPGAPLGLLLHGPLNGIPIHLLPSPLPGGEALTFRNPVFYAPSLRALGHWMAQEATPAGPLIAFADPLGDLPDARAEVVQVGEALQASAGAPTGARRFLGEEATVSALVAHAPKAGILHIATHARGASEAGPASLTLRPSPQGGWLYLPDGAGMEEPAQGQVGVELITHLKLQADLVTLATCEGGAGEIGASGEGLEILSWAFLIGGARSVLSCGWPAHDGATRELMHRFYGHRALGASKAQALSRAQRELVAAARAGDLALSGRPLSPAWAHPHYWGAYVLTGDHR